MPILNLSSPLSLYSIPVIWLSGFYPGSMRFMAVQKSIEYNNIQPRANLNRALQDPKVSKELAGRLERMEGAHQNGNEAFPLWAAAILAGNFAGLDNRMMNKIAAAYIVLRILYNHAYIDYGSVAKGWLRSTLFFASLSLPLTLLIKAASKVANHA